MDAGKWTRIPPDRRWQRDCDPKAVLEIAGRPLQPIFFTAGISQESFSREGSLSSGQ